MGEIDSNGISNVGAVDKGTGKRIVEAMELWTRAQVGAVDKGTVFLKGDIVPSSENIILLSNRRISVKDSSHILKTVNRIYNHLNSQRMKLVPDKDSCLADREKLWKQDK